MINENYPLKHIHSFGIDVYSKYFAPFTSIGELQERLAENPNPKQPLLILGGGSNVLFTKNFDGLILKNEIISLRLTS